MAGPTTPTLPPVGARASCCATTSSVPPLCDRSRLLGMNCSPCCRGASSNRTQHLRAVDHILVLSAGTRHFQHGFQVAPAHRGTCRTPAPRPPAWRRRSRCGFRCGRAPGSRVIENKYSTDVESPPPPPDLRAYACAFTLKVHGKSCGHVRSGFAWLFRMSPLPGARRPHRRRLAPRPALRTPTERR